MSADWHTMMSEVASAIRVAQFARRKDLKNDPGLDTKNPEELFKISPRETKCFEEVIQVLDDHRPRVKTDPFPRLNRRPSAVVLRASPFSDRPRFRMPSAYVVFQSAQKGDVRGRCPRTGPISGRRSPVVAHSAKGKTKATDVPANGSGLLASQLTSSSSVSGGSSLWSPSRLSPHCATGSAGISPGASSSGAVNAVQPPSIQPTPASGDQPQHPPRPPRQLQHQPPPPHAQPSPQPRHQLLSVQPPSQAQRPQSRKQRDQPLPAKRQRTR